MLYETASAELKQMLEDTFTVEFFNKDVTERIKTYEDACSELGIDPVSESHMRSGGFTTDVIVYCKIRTITKALNEGWKPNWKDENQKKWVPWFATLSPSGFAFLDSFFNCTSPIAGYASRPCFKSEELAKYAGEQFIELYKDFIL